MLGVPGRSLLFVVAPAAGGVLIATVGPAPALWCEAGGFLVAAISLTLIRRPFRTAAAGGSGRVRRSMAAEIGEGLRYLRGHRVIWPLTIMGFGFGMASGTVTGLLVVYGVRELGLADDDARLAWLYSATALGSLIAVAAMPRLFRRFGRLRTVLAARWVDIAFFAAVVAAPNLPLAILALVVWYGASALAIFGSIALRMQLTPDHLQGRVNTTGRMIAYGGMPLGAALGGAFAEVIDVRLTMLIMGGGSLAALAWGGAIGLRGVDDALVSRMIDDAEHPSREPHERSTQSAPGRSDLGATSPGPVLRM